MEMVSCLGGTMLEELRGTKLEGPRQRCRKKQEVRWKLHRRGKKVDGPRTQQTERREFDGGKGRLYRNKFVNSNSAHVLLGICSWTGSMLSYGV